MVGEDLDDGDMGVAVVDDDVDAHLVEREDGGVGSLFVFGNEGAGVWSCLWGEEQEQEQKQAG